MTTVIPGLVDMTGTGVGTRTGDTVTTTLGVGTGAGFLLSSLLPFLADWTSPRMVNKKSRRATDNMAIRLPIVSLLSPITWTSTGSACVWSSSIEEDSYHWDKSHRGTSFRAADLARRSGDEISVHLKPEDERDEDRDVHDRSSVVRRRPFLPQGPHPPTLFSRLAE